jgi:hypothetical protein
MPVDGNFSIKRATIACRYHSFYDNSRSCGAAKNLKSLAQLAHYFHFPSIHQSQFGHPRAKSCPT